MFYYHINMEITIFTTQNYIMKKIIILITGLLYCSIISAQQYTDQYIKDATVVSMKWLNDLNHKEYDKCWSLNSDEAKEIYSSLDNWKRFANNLMSEFGYLKSRKVTNAFFLSQIEGKEDGFYVFVEYDCEYELTQEHKEIMILKQNDQAKWQIDSWEYQFISQEEKDKK